MTESIIDIISSILALAYYVFSFYFIFKCFKLNDRLEELENQLNTIIKNSVDYCNRHNFELVKLRKDIDKINEDFDAHCEYDSFKFNLFDDKISNLYDSPHLVFFSKRRDKNG